MAEGNLPGTRPVYQSVIQTASGSFEAFYQGTSGRLLRYAYGLTGDMAEAQDFTQEAYVRAWQRWARLRDYDNPESWLRLVVTRLATDRWRWLGRRRPLEASSSRAPRSPRRFIHDYDGRDITPPGLADRSAQWLGDDQVLLIRWAGPADQGGPTGPAALSMPAELSVYSFDTQRETSLGEVVLHGGCGTAPGKVVCPTEEGFTVYH